MTLSYLRRTPEVNQQYLLPKVDHVVFCRPTETQIALYRQLLGSRFLRRCVEAGGSGGGGGSNHLVSDCFFFHPLVVCCCRGPIQTCVCSSASTR